jgi:hypothetical protein
MIMEPENKSSLNLEGVLTSIRNMYTLSTTPDQNASEAEKIMIENFLQTLSEVALTIASRKAGSNSSRRTNH